MSLLFSAILTQRKPYIEERGSQIANILSSMMQQGYNMKDSWSEIDITNLATEEPDKFDRKSGLLLCKNENDFFVDLAKAISAFANSGGGAIIIGVEDNGIFNGIEPIYGKTSTKEWLEQKIPNLVEYPLSLFRVHTVIRSSVSQIPEGKILIVIEVGDSPAAPHQSTRDRKYYHRVGSHSAPARHFYVELLRQRLTSAQLSFQYEKPNFVDACLFQDRIFIESKIRFRVENNGKIASYKWNLSPREYNHHTLAEEDLTKIVFIHYNNFPFRKSRNSSLALDNILLPGLIDFVDTDIAVWLPKPMQGKDAIKKTLSEIMLGLSINYKLATENSPGEMVNIIPFKAGNVEEVFDLISEKKLDL